jgi:hypothetical protein
MTGLRGHIIDVAGERCSFIVSIMVLVVQIESVLHLTFCIRRKLWIGQGSISRRGHDGGRR